MVTPSSVVAIDPGTEVSGVVLLAGREVLAAEVRGNAGLLLWLRAQAEGSGRDGAAVLALEWTSHYGTGMPVGSEVFKAVEWGGRFLEAWRGPAVKVTRPEVKHLLCGNRNAKDPHVRQALLDRWGGTSVALGKQACVPCQGKGKVAQPLTCPRCGGLGGGQRHSRCERCNMTGKVLGSGPCKACGGAKRSAPGPLHGVTEHAWAALAVAVCVLEGLGLAVPSVDQVESAAGEELGPDEDPF